MIKFLFNYIKSNISMFILLIIVFSVTYMIFFSYSLSFEAFAYMWIITLLIFLIYAILKFYNIYKEHIYLTRIFNNTYSSFETLYRNTPISVDYQNIILKLYKNISNLENKYILKAKDMSDYYTMWLHQVKTPLSAIKLILQVESTPINSDVESEIFKIEQYIEMILFYFRIDSGTTDYVIKNYDSHSIIIQAVKKYAKFFIKKKIKLIYNENHINILTDEKWIVFIIEQVISNAIKYTKESGVIEITASKNSISVKDNGIGISAEDIPRVFDKGYTGYNGRLDKRATGIGLYLCKKIIDKLGHNISISSVIDEGTEVTIKFENKEDTLIF